MNDFGLMIARYNSVLPTLDDQQLTQLQVDENGRLLVQANVTVKIDFLGLNAAADSSNILIVGTEDGTPAGDAHPIRVLPDGAVVIRPLDFATDKVDVSGSQIESTVKYEGDTEYDSTDPTGTGAVVITAAATPWVDVAAIAVDAGEVLKIAAIDWTCDQNATARLITDDTVNTVVLKVSNNSTAMPDVFKLFTAEALLEIQGAADLQVKLQIKKRAAAGGNANGHGSIHAKKLT
jgi:hypothetical protein